MRTKYIQPTIITVYIEHSTFLLDNSITIPINSSEEPIDADNAASKDNSVWGSWDEEE